MSAFTAAVGAAEKMGSARGIRVGDLVSVERLGACCVLVVRPAGTIDVERVKDGACFRVSGLALTSGGFFSARGGSVETEARS